jgi:hypothetical protein
MRRFTVTLEERVAEWTRAQAAELDISFSRLVSMLLQEAMRSEPGYDAACRSPRSLGTGASGHADTAHRTAAERTAPRSWR